MQGANNLVAKVNTETGKFIIKIYVPPINEKNILYYADLFNYLTSRKFPVQKILQSKTGFITKFKNKPCVILNYIEGDHIYEVNNYFLKGVGKLSIEV